MQSDNRRPAASTRPAERTQQQPTYSCEQEQENHATDEFGCSPCQLCDFHDRSDDESEQLQQNSTAPDNDRFHKSPDEYDNDRQYFHGSKIGNFSSTPDRRNEKTIVSKTMVCATQN